LLLNCLPKPSNISVNCELQKSKFTKKIGHSYTVTLCLFWELRGLLGDIWSNKLKAKIVAQFVCLSAFVSRMSQQKYSMISNCFLISSLSNSQICPRPKSHYYRMWVQFIKLVHSLHPHLVLYVTINEFIQNSMKSLGLKGHLLL
jgi:hypothetical protein